MLKSFSPNRICIQKKNEDLTLRFQDFKYQSVPILFLVAAEVEPLNAWVVFHAGHLLMKVQKSAVASFPGVVRSMKMQLLEHAIPDRG